MPYKVKCSNGCKVMKKGTRKTYSKKPMCKECAMRQMRALYLAESKKKKKK